MRVRQPASFIAGSAVGHILFPVARFTSLLFLVAALHQSASAQTPLAGVGQTLHLINTDLAVLESQIVHKDLQCTVAPTDPVLGFDLRFHGGYDVTIPLKELIGDENLLTMMMRVTPKSKDGDSGEPQYFVQKV